MPLTERDHDVLLSVYQYRYLTTSQVQRLHFPSARTAQRRLASLTEWRLVAPFSVADISDRIYRLTARGTGAVAERLGVDPEELPGSGSTRPPKDHYFMRHFAAISDFQIALTKACAQACAGRGVRLLGFIPEHYGSRHRSGRLRKYLRDVAFAASSPREKITHTPDGVFALEKERKAALFFLEIDRGTEVLSNPARGVGKMIRFYEGYAREERYKGYAEDFGGAPFANFRVLFVTTSAGRVGSIRQAWGREAPPFYRFVWLTAQEQVSEAALFEPIWRSLDAGDDTDYRIA